MSEKTKSKKGLVVGIFAVIIAVAVAFGLAFGLRKNEEASAIMQLETNPGVQLILDDDTVIGEVAINEDGEEMLALVSFVGLKVEVAAEKFAQTAAEMDKMNSGDESAVGSKVVRITISAEDSEYYQNLANKAKETVNSYFAENGVFAGAVTEVNNNIKEAIDKMQTEAKLYQNMTTEELFAFAKAQADELKQVAFEKRSEISTTFESIHETILTNLDSAYTLLVEARQNLEDATEDSSAEEKEFLQKAFDEAEKAYNEVKNQLTEKYEEFVANLKEESKQILETIKETAMSAYETTINLYNERVEEFKTRADAEIAEIQQRIADFQAGLA